MKIKEDEASAGAIDTNTAKQEREDYHYASKKKKKKNFKEKCNEIIRGK